jgi:hypothetical protein
VHPHTRCHCAVAVALTCAGVSRVSLQGRISRCVTVPLPDEAGRAAILGVHLRSVTLDETAGDKTQLARQLAALTTGFSGGWGQPAGDGWGSHRPLPGICAGLHRTALHGCASLV